MKKRSVDPGLERAAEAAILARLAAASEPLGLGGLFARKPGAADTARVARLLANGSIVNIAAGRQRAFATAEDAMGRFSPVALARRALQEHLGVSLRPLALSVAAMAKVKAPGHVRPALGDAAAAMVRAGELIPVQVGRSRLVIAVAGIQQHLANQVAAGEKPAPAAEPGQGGSVSPDAVSAAYRRAIAPGASMLVIGALQRELQIPLAELHATLRRMLADRQLVLVLGDPSFLSAEDRAAALGVDGSAYHYVELSAPRP